MEVTYFGKGSALSNLLHAINEGTQINPRNGGIAHKFHEIVNNYDGPPLYFHTSIVQCPYKEWNKNGEGGRGHLRDKGCG